MQIIVFGVRLEVITCIRLYFILYKYSEDHELLGKLTFNNIQRSKVICYGPKLYMYIMPRSRTTLKQKLQLLKLLDFRKRNKS